MHVSDSLEPNRQPEPAARTSGRRRIIAIIALIVLLALGAGSFAATKAIRGPSLHAGTPPPAVGLTPDEQAYYDYVAPRSHQLIAELHLLADMGRQQSHNVIVLERHYNATSKLIDEIQQYQAQHGVPARFAPAATPLAAGIARVQFAMTNAQSAFLSLQFSKLGPLLEQFETGADIVDQSVNMLDAAGGRPSQSPATPTLTP
jgi:hypothetical protein